MIEMHSSASWRRGVHNTRGLEVNALDFFIVSSCCSGGASDIDRWLVVSLRCAARVSEAGLLFPKAMGERDTIHVKTI